MPFLEFIYNEPVLGVVLALLLAGGTFLPNDEFKKFTAAKACWWLLALYLCGRVLMWSVLTHDKFHVRTFWVFLAFGVIGVFCSEMVRVVDGREMRLAGTEQEPPKSPPVQQSSQGANSPNIVGSGNTVIIHPEVSKPTPKSASMLSAKESMQIGATPGAGDYVQKLGGIEWKPEYSELQISFGNPTSRDFANLDITVLPDIMIAATGEVTNFNVQFIASGSNVPLPTNINEQLAEKRKKGENYKVVLPLSLTNATRFRCATLPRHSVLIIILALVNRKAAQQGIQMEFSVEPNGPKALPKHLTVTGSYQDGEQPYELSKEFKF